MLTMIRPRTWPPSCSPISMPNSRYMPTGSATVNSMKKMLVTVMRAVCPAERRVRRRAVGGGPGLPGPARLSGLLWPGRRWPSVLSGVIGDAQDGVRAAGSGDVEVAGVMAGGAGDQGAQGGIGAAAGGAHGRGVKALRGIRCP